MVLTFSKHKPRPTASRGDSVPATRRARAARAHQAQISDGLALLTISIARAVAAEPAPAILSRGRDAVPIRVRAAYEAGNAFPLAAFQAAFSLAPEDRKPQCVAASNGLDQTIQHDQLSNAPLTCT